MQACLKENPATAHQSTRSFTGANLRDSTVFVDSSIFIALTSRRDQWHTQSRALFDDPPADLATSTLIIAESYGWILQKIGEDRARDFLRLTELLPGLNILNIARAQLRQVATTLDRYRGIKLSYVDAASLVLIQELKIKMVWSTDHHLGITGARVLPVS